MMANAMVAAMAATTTGEDAARLARALKRGCDGTRTNGKKKERRRVGHLVRALVRAREALFDERRERRRVGAHRLVAAVLGGRQDGPFRFRPRRRPKRAWAWAASRCRLRRLVVVVASRERERERNAPSVTHNGARRRRRRSQRRRRAARGGGCAVATGPLRENALLRVARVRSSPTVRWVAPRRPPETTVSYCKLEARWHRGKTTRTSMGGQRKMLLQ